MKFQDNFSETNLIFSQDVEFILYDENNANEIECFCVHFPTFKNCYFDYKFQFFLHIINSPLENITKNLKNIDTITTKYSLFKNILAFPDANEFYYKIIYYALHLIIPQGLYIDKMQWKICGYDFSQELFNRIIDLILVATEHKQLHELNIIDPKMREMQERINKIKKTGQNIQSEHSFINSYMILTYEFNYTPEQILNMTMYCMNQILKYTSKSINYKISLIGAGNGLSKKVHFITEKGR